VGEKTKALRITGFLDFVHRPEFYILENTTIRKLDLFLSSGEGRETPTLLGPLERASLNPSNSECYTPSSEPFRF
jgi:hypothetical protein